MPGILSEENAASAARKHSKTAPRDYWAAAAGLSGSLGAVRASAATSQGTAARLLKPHPAATPPRRRYRAARPSAKLRAALRPPSSRWPQAAPAAREASRNEEAPRRRQAEGRPASRSSLSPCASGRLSGPCRTAAALTPAETATGPGRARCLRLAGTRVWQCRHASGRISASRSEIGPTGRESQTATLWA